MELICKDGYYEVWCTTCKVLISTWSNKYGLNPVYEIVACPKCNSNYIDTVDPVVLGIMGRTDILKNIEDEKNKKTEEGTVTANMIEGDKKRMKKIGIDMDGVIADFISGFSSAANQMDSSLPIISEGQVKDWDLVPWYCDKKTLSKIWNYIRKNRPFFWTELETLISKQTWGRISYNQMEMYFITARIELGYISAQKQTIAWVKSMTTRGITPQVICSNQKMKICNILNIDYYLDDKPDNLLGFDQIGTKGYLLYKPYMKKNIVPLLQWSEKEMAAVYQSDSGEHIRLTSSVDEFLDKAGV